VRLIFGLRVSLHLFVSDTLLHLLLSHLVLLCLDGLVVESLLFPLLALLVALDVAPALVDNISSSFARLLNFSDRLNNS